MLLDYKMLINQMVKMMMMDMKELKKKIILLFKDVILRFCIHHSLVVMIFVVAENNHKVMIDMTEV
jgi:hypothetical protein